MKNTAIVLFGIPCSGKGTVGKALFAEFPHIFYHLSSGDLVREAQKARGDLADQIGDYLSRGVLIPDEIMVPMYRGGIASRIASGKFKADSQHLLVDGMCRTPAQAEDLSDFLEFREVWHFTNVPNCEVLRRSSIRAEEEGRTDDTKKAMLKRIKEYWNITYPTLDFFASKNISIRCINAYESKSIVISKMKKYAKVKYRITSEW
ncbi:nucleoside monophosphate kinase [Candidatus Woesearchaeota archaeon]|nr:nucleoside monophosphate kinase [Candidatus Woesearchaeota archaeon]MBW3016010.1 nucleoside monophosphate kinase [Candidatus Woesearchaeota archaeon]